MHLLTVRLISMWKLKAILSALCNSWLQKRGFEVATISFSKPSNALFCKHYVDLNNDSAKKNETDELYNVLNPYHHIKLTLALALDPIKFLKTKSI